MEQNRKAFVLMPFAPQYKEVYDEVYKKVCSENGFDCWRVDEVSGIGCITQDIVSGIIDADIVIADLSSKNPNVFYELGIAHTVGKKTIMTAQSKEDVPFDIGSYRIVFYEQSIAGSRKLYADLDRTIKGIKKTITETANPVQSALSQRSFISIKQKKPLAQVINISMCPKNVRDLFETESIFFVEDLYGLDLDEMKAKYNLGPGTLGYLVKLILKTEMYTDYARIQDFIIKNRVNLSCPKNIFLEK